MTAAAEKPRLLVVDDDEDFLDLMVMRLGSRYEVDLARDGEEALARVSEGSPDLVLLDIMMPRLGGWSVCWTLKNHARFRGIPILVLTALQDTGATRSQLARADDYLVKPFDWAALDRKIEDLLAGPRPS